MTEMSSNASGTIVPFPIDRVCRPEGYAEATEVFFDIVITFGERQKVLGSSAGEQHDDIHRSIIQELADIYKVLTDAMEVLGPEGQRPVVSIKMNVGHEQTADVGPAISQLVFIDNFSQKDRSSSERFPNRITSELLNAMARSHFAIIGKELAEAEMEDAKRSLNSAMLLHGMLEEEKAE